MPSAIETTAFHRDVHPDGRPLTKLEREQLVARYLPEPPPPSHSVLKSSQQASDSSVIRPSGLQGLVQVLLHKLVYFVIQLLFSIYVRARWVYNTVNGRAYAVLKHHHRSPELIKKDVKHLDRLPQHLSIIVDLAAEDNRHDAEALAKLVADVAELAAWCTCAGIPMLSVYERTGILKTHIPSLHSSVTRTFHAYYPPGPTVPSLHIRAPHHPAYSPPSSPSLQPTDSQDPQNQSPSLNLLLLSSSDGRDTLVDLTKTLAEMAQRRKLQPADVSAELINAEVSESSCTEPDLLVIMASDRVSDGGSKKKKGGKKARKSSVRPADEKSNVAVGGGLYLRGYPPWQARLTEIYHAQDNAGVDYHTFLRALYNFARAQMRFGR